MHVSWQCESDEFCRAVLAKHWPNVPCYRDVATLTGAQTAPVDILCGGFPCQDISVLWTGEGLDGTRSGLWREFLRLIGEIRPRYVIVENVPALLARGLGRLLGDLAEIGYDAEWDCLPAAAFGAPHLRNRIWIVAYPSSTRRRQNTRGSSSDETTHERRPSEHDHVSLGDGAGGRAKNVADPDAQRWERWARNIRQEWRSEFADSSRWPAEPDVGRVANGVPARMDRLASLGNSLIPAIAEAIGKRILAFETAKLAA
jgi:DNA (cytosine-5)-methyltransferase 1